MADLSLMPFFTQNYFQARLTWPDNKIIQMNFQDDQCLVYVYVKASIRI